ncbi:hypothetical protein GALMADRAFT_143191 [Galerina marginata CBS 339.88]|uniref:Uncharacterized protein n=1 Tax=Galerina marginata (strain CBS 339.88) TaxID=685588 RepID=A0A067SXD4_GALM3|nr:hypothetical protein GALMADRAFT_143191 [Galerina marginata CBS 339.88]
MWNLLALTYLAFGASAQQLTWCGKNYEASEPVLPPGGLFSMPATSTTPLLALRCSPAIRPYIAEDATSTSDDVAFLIDTIITFSEIANANPIRLPDVKAIASTPVSVTVEVVGKTLATGNVPLNVTKHALPFKLSSLQPRTQAYNITCTATVDSQTFHASGSLSFLPDPPADIGSVTKMDLRTGALLARPADGKGGPFAPVFPMGFYTSFGGFLDQNPTTLPAQIKAQGHTLACSTSIHPIPTFDNATALKLLLDSTLEAGLYLVYDMRNVYQNSTAVTAQVNQIKSRPNLLLWYTGDEPDGNGDPLNGTLMSSNLIQSLDGGDGQGGAGYHPVSLVLNCENYFYNEYAGGADIILQDTYMIGINATFSTQFGTPCTLDFGDCGCDNCIGSFEDISTRMDEFKARNLVNGWERTKAVWTVPQGFINNTYWNRDPTGQEFVVQSVIGINHGALGVTSWMQPTTDEVQSSASTFAKSLPQLTPFILNPSATSRQITVNRTDVGLWTVSGQTLILATNMNSFSVSVSLKDLGLSSPQPTAKQILNMGVQMDPSRAHLMFNSIGTGAFIVKS